MKKYIFKGICQDWEAELKAMDFRPNAEHFYNISPEKNRGRMEKFSKDILKYQNEIHQETWALVFTPVIMAYKV